MDADLVALGRRAVACEGWRWRKGLVSAGGRVFLGYTDDGKASWIAHPDDGAEVGSVENLAPDLSCPLTVGWLLALVREKWGHRVFASPGPLLTEAWRVFQSEWAAYPVATGPTEAAALVAALEAGRG